MVLLLESTKNFMLACVACKFLPADRQIISEHVN